MSLQTNRNHNSAEIYLEPYPSGTTRSLPARESQNKEEAIYMTIDDNYEKWEQQGFWSKPFLKMS